MNAPEPPTDLTRPNSWVDRFAKERPDVALMAPFLAYLLLLGLRDSALLSYEYRWAANLIRGVGALAVVWILRRHMPPWGKSHWLLAACCGVLVAAGWYYGQFFFNYLGIPHRIPLPLFGGEFELTDPREKLGEGSLFWATATTRVLVASTTVAVVEEVFWRAFLLRALINWEKFEQLPLGSFTWKSFLISSLLSTLEHPDNWAVSIPCWFAFNALMYWKKSLLFLVFVHGFTNLFLYAWVLYQVTALDNTQAWMFW